MSFPQARRDAAYTDKGAKKTARGTNSFDGDEVFFGSTCPYSHLMKVKAVANHAQVSTTIGYVEAPDGLCEADGVRKGPQGL